jgi:hypothetical protein
MKGDRGGGANPGERLRDSLSLIGEGSRGMNGLFAAFESIRGGGGMRPDGAGRSDRLLNVGPPKVAARLIFEAMLGGGESDMTVEVGDIGSGTAAAERLVSLSL